MACFGLQIEIKHFVIIVKDLADVPDNTFVDHRLACTHPVRDVERAFSKTDGFGAEACTVMIIENQSRCALEPKV